MLPALPTALVLLAAGAAGNRLAVLELDAPPNMIGLAAQVTQAVVVEAQAQHKKVLGPDELRAQLGNKGYEELAKCRDSAACATLALKPLGVDQVVLGSLGRDERNYLVRLWLVDAGTAAVVADVDRAILIASRRFQRDVEQAVGPFLRGQREPRGTLVLKTTAAKATVSVNGELKGQTPLTLQLKPGRYEVKVEKKAYLPVTRLVDVEANQTRTEELRLLRVPGEVPDEEIVPALQAAPSAEGAPPPGFQPRWPTFVAGGLAVAAAGVGLGFGLSAQTKERALLAGYDAATETWAGTRAQAIEAQTHATVATVGWAAAGGFLGVALISLIVDATQPGTPVVAPVAAPGGAGVVVGGSF